MGNPEIEGLKAEIARLRKENDAQQTGMPSSRVQEIVRPA